MNKQIRFLCQGAIVSAVYALLTLATWTFSSMQIQVRLSEALCVLPLFTPAAIPGLFFGCFLSNILMGNIIDAIFGSLATLLAALCTYFIGKLCKKKLRLFLAPLPAVVFNAIAVPLILYFGYGVVSFGEVTGVLPVLSLTALSVFIGQTISCYGLGLSLTKMLEKLKFTKRFF